MSEQLTGKFNIEYYDENWEKRETVVEFTPAINELIKDMKDTHRIDEEIAILQKEIDGLEKLKLYSCMDCEDKYCKYAGIKDDLVCQSHSVYGR